MTMNTASLTEPERTGTTHTLMDALALKLTMVWPAF